jgi:sugar phosphate isomerase/epimerase
MSRKSGEAARRRVDRRDFLETAFSITVAGLPLLGTPSRLAASPPDRPALPPARLSFPIGIQLYTLRDLLQQDLEGTLAKLAALGCQEVEFAGTYGHPPAEVRKILDRLHLKAPSGHCDIPAVTNKLSETIEIAKTLGHHYVTVAWIPDESRTTGGYGAVADIFNHAGAELRKAGLALGYHNHSFEFDPLENGHTGYDILLDRTDPRLLTMELDLFWIRHAGKDAMDYFRRYRGRFSMVHVKDMAADGAMVDVGAGVMKWPELLQAAREAGVKHAFVEHDEARDPLAFARTSFDYMKRLARG